MSLYTIQIQWDTYYPKVYGYFYKRIDSKDAVEDLSSLTMEAFLKAINHPSKPILNLNGYLWKIAHNQLVNYIKYKSKHPQIIPFDENTDFVDKSFEDYRSAHFQAKVQNLMRCVEKNLSGMDFKIVQLAIMYDKKSPEVAKELNIKTDNVRQKLSRSLKKLKTQCLDIWNI